MQTLENYCPTRPATAAPEYNEATEISLMDGVDDGIPVFPSTPFWPMSIIPNHLLIAMIITINIQVNRKAEGEYRGKKLAGKR